MQAGVARRRAERLATQPLRTLLWDVTAADRCKELRATRVHRPNLSANASLGIVYSTDGRSLGILGADTPNTWVLDAASGQQKVVLKSPGGVRSPALGP